MKTFHMVLVCLLCAACAGKTTYTHPSNVSGYQNSKTVNKSKDELWKKLIPALGAKFFVINNLDKESGLINISYSGDPEEYIDCGRLISEVQNVRGKRTYDFPLARAYQQYEVMDMESGTGLWFMEQRMELEGRMNLILQEISPTQILVTANTRYVVTRTLTSKHVARPVPETYSGTISFNSGQSKTFPASRQGTTCRANGKFEREVLSLIN